MKAKIKTFGVLVGIEPAPFYMAFKILIRNMQKNTKNNVWVRARYRTKTDMRERL